MIQQKKWYFNSETVITAQNIQKIAELITVGAVKNVMIHSSRDLYRLYKDLLADINRPQDSLELYSDSYDYVQEAICFLCEFLGKKTGDLCTDKFGKKAPVSTAAQGISVDCFSKIIVKSPLTKLVASKIPHCRKTQ